MKLAIVGSRNVTVDRVEEYVPDGVEAIVSGGAAGVDRCAAEYAKRQGIPLVEFLPDYGRYGRAAPLKRNERIALYADAALVFWDGTSRGTAYTVRCFERLGKPVTVIRVRD